MDKALFIRHGEAVDNFRDYLPSDTTPLSPLGRNDIERLQVVIGDLSPEIICYGTSTRAKESVGILFDYVQARDFENPLFNERRLPSAILGQPHTDDSVKRIVQTMRTHALDPDWNHSDEENYHEFITRVVQMLSFVFSLREKRVAIITHAGVMKALLAITTPKVQNKLEKFLEIDDAYSVRSAGFLQLKQTPIGKPVIELEKCLLPR